MHEDVVVACAAKSIRESGGLILAEGGNQMRAFCFKVSTGRRKAPDLAFLFGSTLTIVEAKVKASALFRPAADGLSDFTSLCEVQRDDALRAMLLSEAIRRLRACGFSGMPPSTVRTALLAGEPVLKLLPPDSSIGAMYVDSQSQRLVIER